jgi:type II secretory pathway pseudopilin PulG
LPLLGSAYSRAREYSSDMHGVYCSASPEAAARGVAALAAGGKRWHSLDLAEYSAQANASGGFWMSYHELIGGYPWLSKRMARVLTPGANPQFPRRNVFAWALACITPSGGVVSLIIVAYIVGVLAAVALPAYQDYTQRAKMSVSIAKANEAASAVGRYYSRTQIIPQSLEDAGAPAPTAGDGIDTMRIDPKSGVITIVMAAPFAGQEFSLIPAEGPNNTVTWTCKPGTVKPQNMPASCR